MRPIRVLCIALPLACAAAHAADNNGALATWVGKYPSDTRDAKGGSLLQQPPLRTTLKTILPRPEAALLGQLDNESPVRQSGHYLVVDKCRPHDCPADAAMIVIDLESTKVWAAFFTRTSASVSTRWYGNQDDYNTLPDDIRTGFLKQHGSIVP